MLTNCLAETSLDDDWPWAMDVEAAKASKTGSKWLDQLTYIAGTLVVDNATDTEGYCYNMLH